MNIQELLEKYQDNGYDYEDASSKVCQDIIVNVLEYLRNLETILV